VLKTDALVSGVHFLPDDPADLARKLLRVNLSDLAEHDPLSTSSPSCSLLRSTATGSSALRGASTRIRMSSALSSLAVTWT
jgi:hypothetical protein